SLIRVAATLSLVASAIAQTPPAQDGWVWHWSFNGLIVADQTFGVIGSDPITRSLEYSVDSGWRIWESGPPLSLRHFTGPNAPGVFSVETQGAWPRHDRRRVWLITANGLLSWVDKINPTSEFSAGNLHGAWASNEFVGSMCTNGRDLFFSIRVTAADPY